MKKICLFGIFGLLFGCASNRVVITPKTFDYNNPKLEHSYVRSGVSKELYVGRFNDNREIKDLGTVSTGLFDKKTKVELKSKFGDTFSSELTKLFIKKGLRVTPKSNAEYELSGSIEKFELWEDSESFGTEFTACVAQVALKVRHIKTDSMRWKGSFSVEYRTEGSFMDSTHKTGYAATLCLNGIAEKLLKMKKFQTLIDFDLVK